MLVCVEPLDGIVVLGTENSFLSVDGANSDYRVLNYSRRPSKSFLSFHSICL